MPPVKILISDTAKLYPPVWGGPKRIWNLFANLAQDLFDITYIGIDHTLSNSKKYSFNRIRNNFKEVLCAFPPHYYPWHLIEKKLIRDPSLDLFAYLRMHTDWHFRHILKSQKADVLISSHPWSFLSMPKKNEQIFIYDAHNCEYLLMNQILGNHLLKRLTLRGVRKAEACACKKSNLILACSENEKQDLIDLYNVKAECIYIIPNGSYAKPSVSYEQKKNAKRELKINPERKVIIFVGAYYRPNLDAVRFIVRNIAPALQEFTFLIVGNVAREFRSKKHPFNVNFLGQSSDQQLDLALKSSDIAINPMFSGSGINIKMLDYMSYGLPVVTTEHGARGIKTEGKSAMIVSSVDKFIDNIRMLSADQILYRRMSEDARTLIAERYNWKAISNKLQQIILEKLR